MNKLIKPIIRTLAQIAVVFGVCACQSMPHAQEDYVQPNVEYKHYSLTLIGMNYTNRYIDQFFVNGQGGGNLFVSTPTSGGGKSACCVGWSTTTKLPVKVKVKWHSGGCTITEVTRSGYQFKTNRSFFKEKEVTFNGPVPNSPKYFVVHIYENDDVEISISDDYPAPRLQLSEGRRDRTPYPPCDQNGVSDGN
ncbi:MAG TPA: DUF3304 domain-containing protein [Burkholderiaceae bacterium]|nr:DUF3304 domain-containing protein [Burkholderiaceae bacterium]